MINYNKLLTIIKNNKNSKKQKQNDKKLLKDVESIEEKIELELNKHNLIITEARMQYVMSNILSYLENYTKKSKEQLPSAIEIQINKQIKELINDIIEMQRLQQ